MHFMRDKKEDTCRAGVTGEGGWGGGAPVAKACSEAGKQTKQ